MANLRNPRRPGLFDRIGYDVKNLGSRFGDLGSQFKSDFDYITGSKTFNPAELDDYDARTKDNL
jgi:hypothetical protein